MGVPMVFRCDKSGIWEIIFEFLSISHIYCPSETILWYWHILLITGSLGSSLSLSKVKRQIRQQSLLLICIYQIKTFNNDILIQSFQITSDSSILVDNSWTTIAFAFCTSKFRIVRIKFNSILCQIYLYNCGCLCVRP